MDPTTRRRTVLRRTVTASVLALGLSPLLLPSNAQAVATSATVTFSGPYLTYQAAGGQVNHLTVTKSAESVVEEDPWFGAARYTYILDDTVAIATDSDRCTYPTSTDQTRVVCSWVYSYQPDPVVLSTFKLGDKNDTVTFVDPDGDTYAVDRFYLVPVTTPTPASNMSTETAFAARPATTRSPSITAPARSTVVRATTRSA